MIRIHTMLTGQPQAITDERGTWRSAIFRQPVIGPVELHPHGLDGDQVADTANHGSLDQAVCCHPLTHYAYWNSVYELTTPNVMLGPGGVGENWTVENVSEAEIYVGDIFTVGSARVQVTGPRYPCTKQERKLNLPGFHQRTVETMRTGFYLRVLTPGTVQAGDSWTLEDRPQPDLPVHRVNVCAHQSHDRDEMLRLREVPELGSVWKRILTILLDHYPA